LNALPVSEDIRYCFSNSSHLW